MTKGEYMKLAAILIVFVSLGCPAQVAKTSASLTSSSAVLDKMPPELETKFALSALPPHLRAAAAVYILDPAKGYVPAKAGRNGFSCIVMRTEWEWPQFAFRDDIFVPICYDAEGSKKILPVWIDVAKLRAQGLTSKMVYDETMKRFASGAYQKPARSGISYMTAPLMRSYPAPGAAEVITMTAPHFMLYAPNVKDVDIGGKPFSPYPFMLPQGPGPHDVMILLVGETEQAKILDESKGLVAELCSYRKYLCVDAAPHAHQ
jgi:hypothetical protein